MMIQGATWLQLMCVNDVDSHLMWSLESRLATALSSLLAQGTGNIADLVQSFHQVISGQDQNKEVMLL
jgi:hypothetical protein